MVRKLSISTACWPFSGARTSLQQQQQTSTMRLVQVSQSSPHLHSLKLMYLVSHIGRPSRSSAGCRSPGGESTQAYSSVSKPVQVSLLLNWFASA